jgi:hypothetical protein
MVICGLSSFLGELSMKIKPLLLLMLLVAASDLQAAFYEWTDAGGVVHFTDNRDSIPAAYRKKVRKIEMREEPAAAVPAAQPPQPVPQGAQPLPGGHGEGWWRTRFTSLRAEAKALQEGVPVKQANLAELRRQHAIYGRATDRSAANALEAEIAADQTRLVGLQKKLDDLDLEASRAAVPLEWRK